MVTPTSVPTGEINDGPGLTPRRLVAVLAIIGAPFALLSFLGVPLAGPFGVAVSTILLWVFELLPLPVTALLVPLLSILFGVSTVKQAFAPFGNEILALFLGCFLLSEAMQRHGFDKRLAYTLIGRFPWSLTGRSLAIVMTATTFFISMWISNTAGTVIVVAIIAGFMNEVVERVHDKKAVRNLRLRLLLGAAFGASMGGIATPIGSPPNLIAVEQLSAIGIEISFLGWLIAVAPLAFLALGLLFLVFELRFPLPALELGWAKEEFRAALGRRGALVGAERVVAVVFVVAVLAWLLPDILSAVFPGSSSAALAKSRLTLGTVGLIAGTLLFVLPYRADGAWHPTLRWNEARGIEWGTILLFGGGLALGEMLERTGAAKAVGAFVVGLGFTEPAILLLAVVVLSVALSEFASNTAAAAIILPLIVGLSESLPALQGSEQEFILAATVGASFGFMLPVSTPPNAIIYGTGFVSARELMRTGVIFDILGILLAVGYFLL
ncbi:MAG: hypothetical protein RL417_1606 [Pseudomonadota bacterium]|jgi:sodium-dependent dicarboxylate transporter 2/3/5